MSEIEYDSQIWTVFSVGIISSVIILFYFNENKIPGDLGILALTLGFAILVYSFILVLGYGTKKSIKISDEDYLLSLELSKKWYPRTRWMAEAILIFIGYLYFKSFSESLHIPIIILLIAFLLNCLANCRAKRKLNINQLEEWKNSCSYFKEYFCR